MNNFEDHFNSIYNTSFQKEYLIFHKRRFESLYKIIRKLDPKNILDIGESGFTHMLKRAGFSVNVLTEKNCNLETDKIPYQDNTFDLVIYTEVIEHLHQNYFGSLQEIYRIIMPKGLLLFGTPNSKALWKLLKRGKINESHIREFSMNECLSMLQGSGFNIVFNKFTSYLSPEKYPADPRKTGFIHFVYYYMVKYIPRFEGCILILCQK